MRPFRPVLAGATTLALLVPLAGALPGTAAADTTTPAGGSASSGFLPLQLEIAGHTLRAGQMQLDTSSVDGLLASVRLLPASVDDSTDGTITVPAGESRHVDGSTVTVPSGVPAGLFSVTGPSADLAASTTDGALATASATGLGAVKALGADLSPLAGTLSLRSASNGTAAESTQTLSVDTLELPSLTDILAGLGISLDALPLTALQGLLGLLDSVPAALSSDLDAVQAAIAALPATATAPTDLAGAASATSAAATALTTAQSAFTAAVSTLDLSTVNTALALAGLETLSALTPAAFASAPAATQTFVDALVPGDLGALSSAVTLAQTLLDALQAVLDAITGLLGDLPDALDLPLASLSDLAVSSVARVTGSTPEADVTSTVGAISVLDRDGVTLSALPTVVGAVSTTLKSALALAGITVGDLGLAIGTPVRDSGHDNGFTTATAGLSALTLTLPSVKVPADLLTSRAAALIRPHAATGLDLGASTLAVGQLVDQAQFRPAVVTTTDTPTGTTTGTPPGTVTPGTTITTLARTGASAGIAGSAVLLLLGAGLLARRRRVLADD